MARDREQIFTIRDWEGIDLRSAARIINPNKCFETVNMWAPNVGELEQVPGQELYAIAIHMGPLTSPFEDVNLDPNTTDTAWGLEPVPFEPFRGLATHKSNWRPDNMFNKFNVGIPYSKAGLSTSTVPERHPLITKLINITTTKNVSKFQSAADISAFGLSAGTLIKAKGF